MGLTERFKKKLEDLDLYKEKETESDVVAETETEMETEISEATEIIKEIDTNESIEKEDSDIVNENVVDEKEEEVIAEEIQQPIKNILEDDIINKSEKIDETNKKDEKQEIKEKIAILNKIVTKKEVKTKVENTYQENPIITANYNRCCELETKIIDKIRRTPYWNEYTISAQKKMISAYIDKKIQCGYFSNIENTPQLVQEVLALSNNK